MLFRTAILERISAGNVTLAFRLWRRPTVKAGGNLMTSVGVLAIEAVDEWTMEQITDSDAQAAGYVGRDELLNELSQRSDGKLYRIAFHVFGQDPRIELRSQDQITSAEFEDIRQRLDDLDKRAAAPWVMRVLLLIADHEGIVAGEIATETGIEKARLKVDIRKLKGLGLTESLVRGYRLSPRGKTMLQKLDIGSNWQSVAPPSPRQQTKR